jgi:hypothetical protein
MDIAISKIHLDLLKKNYCISECISKCLAKDRCEHLIYWQYIVRAYFNIAGFKFEPVTSINNCRSNKINGTHSVFIIINHISRSNFVKYNSTSNISAPTRAVVALLVEEAVVTYAGAGVLAS